MSLRTISDNASLYPIFLSLVVVLAATGSARTQSKRSYDDLRVYAVNVVETPPLEKQFTGYGIYLGKGNVITAAHVVGHWPAITHPRVLVAGLDLPATVVKQGSPEETDLALLSVDETQLPVSLRLRRNPLSTAPPPFGTQAVVIYPQKSVETRALSPLFIAPQFRTRFGSLITEAQGSGAGVFDAERRCLLGIISRKIRKFSYRRQAGKLAALLSGCAGNYVPASAIADFLPPDLRF